MKLFKTEKCFGFVICGVHNLINPVSINLIEYNHVIVFMDERSGYILASQLLKTGFTSEPIECLQKAIK
jgi:hypothetical protein